MNQDANFPPFTPSAPGLYYVDRQGKTTRLDVDPKLTLDLPPSPEPEVLITLLRYALSRVEGKPAKKPPADQPSTPALLNLAELSEQTMQIVRALFR